jgi:Carboxypeptidase regulatory-like domain
VSSANPNRLARYRCLMGVYVLLLGTLAADLAAQQSLPDSPGATSAASLAQQSPSTPATGTITGTVTDTASALIPNARVTLEDAESRPISSASSDASGTFTFLSVSPGTYIVRIAASGFASWKINDVIVLHAGENFVIPPVELGVESINTTVNAISMEDLAEQQITAEEHQRILGILPNFYVSYISNAAPLTRKQKFKLAVVVSKDPVTFFTTSVTAGIEQWQNDFSGYGQGFSGYAQRYAATYGDRLSSTFLGAALLPSLFHQDPRYFYKGKGKVVVRALYAISTVVVCKGDNGHWQPNYSNVLGNLGAAGISTLYYPASDQHSVQITIDNTLIGVAYGAFGVLFQEFLLRHLTHGAPPKTPNQP